MKLSMCFVLSHWSAMRFIESVAIEVLTSNGDGEIRTHDPLLARQVLSQLSYTPI